LLAPDARAVMLADVRSVTVPPPLAAVAIWKKFENDPPVLPLPPLVIVEVNVCAEPTVAVV
jgi:hypothetical protein